MNYEDMLNEGKKKLPKIQAEGDRFKIPEVDSLIQGKKTFFNNITKIANLLNRDVNKLFKYLLRELAAPGEIKNNVAIIGSKFTSKEIEAKLRNYIKQFVLCSECGKPDTEIIKENNVYFLKCQACGAKHPIKNV